MKLLVIEFPDTVDISALSPEMEVTVSHDTVSVSGKVMAVAHMAEPPETPTIEGPYLIQGPYPIK